MQLASVQDQFTERLYVDTSARHIHKHSINASIQNFSHQPLLTA